MSDTTEWQPRDSVVYRKLDRYELSSTRCLELQFTGTYTISFYWSVWGPVTLASNNIAQVFIASGRSRTVSGAKAACMRAMNRHKREAQR